eukprot:TRINITY_DN11181_c0_g1_i1.p1 TRINITY_DN11181_c0_g1~~TRINITY_DN11181_c0_g1_i1.p1  ORF type:complete len:154 (+),score=19.61 TRINITY_DN11181_c0_g1_i1:181-642(+)
MSSSEQGRSIIEELNKLTIEQIRQVKDQVDGEVNLLQDSLSRMRTAAGRYEMASKSLQNLSLHPAGKQMLVPLTASLYVPGTLNNPDKVLIDIGTGYFVEKTMRQGKDYCERKIDFLKANHDKIAEVAAEKKNAAEQVNMVLQAKIRHTMSSK